MYPGRLYKTVHPRARGRCLALVWRDNRMIYIFIYKWATRWRMEGRPVPSGPLVTSATGACRATGGNAQLTFGGARASLVRGTICRRPARHAVRAQRASAPAAPALCAGAAAVQPPASRHSLAGGVHVQGSTPSRAPRVDPELRPLPRHPPVRAAVAAVPPGFKICEGALRGGLLPLLQASVLRVAAVAGASKGAAGGAEGAAATPPAPKPLPHTCPKLTVGHACQKPRHQCLPSPRCDLRHCRHARRRCDGDLRRRRWRGHVHAVIGRLSSQGAGQWCRRRCLSSRGAEGRGSGHRRKMELWHQRLRLECGGGPGLQRLHARGQ